MPRTESPSPFRFGVHPSCAIKPVRQARIHFTTECSSISDFAESARKAVEHRLHDELKKRTFARLDVNVGRHSWCWDKFRHAPDYVIGVEAHSNDVVPMGVSSVRACFVLYLQ